MMAYVEKNTLKDGDKAYHNYSIELRPEVICYGRIYETSEESYAHLVNENGHYMTEVKTKKLLHLIENKDAEGLEQYIVDRWEDHQRWVESHSGDSEYVAEF